MSRLFSPLFIAGLALIFVGVLGFAMPYVVTREKHDVAAIGDLKLEATESVNHPVPPALSGSAVVIGMILLAVEISRRSRN
jgi:multisubunit Na+/H+ antiporter MnhC subunit